MLQAQAAAVAPVEQSQLTKDDTQSDEDALHEQHWVVSKGQKMVIYSILLNFLLSGIEKTSTLPLLVNWLLLVCVAIYAITGIVKICSGLGMSQNKKILFMVMAFVPLINLISLVYLNVKATGVLRAAGWKVCLLGARP